VDTATGQLSANGIVSAEPIPNALCLGPGDRYIYSAGQESGQMAIFSVNQDTGELSRSATVPLGNRPAWISVAELTG
jgi:6-phosphogluconolactonase